MRSRNRNILVALIAVFALGAVASASASAALPEFSLSNTKEKFPVSFSGTGGSASWSGPGYAFTCNSTSMAGTISGAKAITKGSLIFSGCKVGADKCHSEGSENNEQIVTGPIEGTLAYISKTSKTVGVDFTAEGTEYWTTMICFGGSRQRVRGSIVMPITTINKLSTKFSVSAHGSSSSYEDELGLKHTVKLEGEIVGGKVFEPLAWEFEDSLTTSKSVEIKA
jgi:hypothetical protein